MVASGAARESLIAVGLAGAYVLGHTAVPATAIPRGPIRDTLALAGTVLTMSAVALTGVADSPYLLLSLAPTIRASFVDGRRAGLATAALAGGLFLALVLTDDQPATTAIAWTSLYLVVALLVGQIRRLFVEAEARASALAASSVETEQRVLRLELAHDLLTTLSEITVASELNPISMGAAALASILKIHPGSAGVIALASDHGPVVVARQGLETDGAVRSTVPLGVSDREVGFVVLSTPAPLAADTLADITTALRPVALAFSNVLLLQGIARVAIQEERSRLARELHDEIGPSLASLGLALDLAVLQHPTEPALATHLQDLRGQVGHLVEDVRTTVAGLREQRHDSLSAGVASMASTLPEHPEISIKLSEWQPPRPPMLRHLVAIIGEAVRNASHHSAATRIVVGGEVDLDRGTVTIADNGRGFDPEARHNGHFGILGMKERARKVDATLQIATGPEGTRVTVSWGEK